jgi:hypothetical protein
MPEFTDLYCNSPETADAVAAYLCDQMAQDEEPPDISYYIEKSTLRLTYGDVMNDKERRAWDMQLMGFRDGYDQGRWVKP